MPAASSMAAAAPDPIRCWTVSIDIAQRAQQLFADLLATPG